MKRKMLPYYVKDLLYQSLETEIGGVEVYRTALTCAGNAGLAEDWKRYLGETHRHVDVLRQALTDLQLDPEHDTPGRTIVRHIGKSLCRAMHLAKGSDDPAAAEMVAAECITLAETKDHLNWVLLRKVVAEGLVASPALSDAVARIEDEENEHLYQTEGWTQELWIKALGLKATACPPEDKAGATTMAQAAAAKRATTEA